MQDGQRFVNVMDSDNILCYNIDMNYTILEDTDECGNVWYSIQPVLSVTPITYDLMKVTTSNNHTYVVHVSSLFDTLEEASKFFNKP